MRSRTSVSSCRVEPHAPATLIFSSASAASGSRWAVRAGRGGLAEKPRERLRLATGLDHLDVARLARTGQLRAVDGDHPLGFQSKPRGHGLGGSRPSSPARRSGSSRRRCRSCGYRRGRSCGYRSISRTLKHRSLYHLRCGEHHRYVANYRPRGPFRTRFAGF
jgi:hypothetical protein